VGKLVLKFLKLSGFLVHPVWWDIGDNRQVAYVTLLFI
jgi:hypothetical protein